MKHDIVLTSKSTVKLDILQNYVNKYNIKVTPLFDPSFMKVNNPKQPFGLNETYKCTMNRLSAINNYLKANRYKNSTPECRYIISIENGLYQHNQQLKDVCCVIIKDRKTGKIYDNLSEIEKTEITLQNTDELLEELKKHPIDTGFKVSIVKIVKQKYNIPYNEWIEKKYNKTRSDQILAGLNTIWTIIMKETIISHVRLISGYPNEQVLFQDYSPVLYHFTPRAFMTQLILDEIPKDLKVDLVAGPELGGMIFAQSVADHLQVGLIPLRKKGSIPSNLNRLTDEDCVLEIDIGDINPLSIGNKNVILIDDVRATGQNLRTSIDLIEQVGGKVVYWITINDVNLLSETAEKSLEGYDGSIVFSS